MKKIILIFSFLLSTCTSYGLEWFKRTVISRICKRNASETVIPPINTDYYFVHLDNRLSQEVVQGLFQERLIYQDEHGDWVTINPDGDQRFVSQLVKTAKKPFVFLSDNTYHYFDAQGKKIEKSDKPVLFKDKILLTDGTVKQLSSYAENYDKKIGYQR